jgi:hypothetical protein
MWLAGILCVTGALLAALGLAVGRRARRLRSRLRKVRGDPLEPVSDSVPLASAAARWHSAELVLAASEGGSVALAAAGGSGTLEVTERELRFRGEAGAAHVPLSRVVEALLVAPATVGAAPGPASFLRVVWVRGGERLSTTFRLDGPRLAAERVRREVHLRAGRAPPLRFGPPG